MARLLQTDLEKDGAHDAILYVRFSPRPNSKTCESLDIQKSRLIKYCEMAELRIMKIVEDPDVSARKVPLAERPGGKILIHELRKTTANNLVVTRIDRLFRNRQDGEYWKDRWNREGIRLHLADEGGIAMDTSTALGSFMFSTILNMSAFVADQIGERTSEALRKMKEEGRRTTQKTPSYGTKFVKRKGKVYIDIEESEQEIIKKMLELRLKNYSLNAIKRYLNDHGMLRRGKKWMKIDVHNVLKRNLRAPDMR